ncbi:hypothetical protein SERLADRAFT_395706 [Serpula lacrymans var. lacrymans S7.9]|uniref:Myb/SANT-like domain-containing protein n=1 Tax=Serpula lacrymans var. lacrymans (strain S7.9) TaxID=578457 RepID=F8P2S2_SERL9|nr:uncharacterized protein SERLADRAFT_395706 [Serpula lacrymans var. lacrymans S7.9]EGO22457.1 hypothetical protein SERLADRAFT_395706 [Serpula lacrymans var. lacrymans S7.9]
MYKRKASASGIETSTCDSKRPRYWLRMNRDTNLATESTSSHNYHGVNATPIPPDIDDGQVSTSTKDRQIWLEAEEVALIAYITSKRSEGGDGMNFPKKFWPKAAVEFNQNIQKDHVVGPAKEGKHCSSKWGRLRSTYKVVTALSEQSGFHWDDTNGADITIESNTVWEEYLKTPGFSQQGLGPCQSNGQSHI